MEMENQWAGKKSARLAEWNSLGHKIYVATFLRNINLSQSDDDTSFLD